MDALRVFGNDSIVFNSGPFTHIDRESLTKNNCSRVYETILDFHIFKDCDKILINSSGYGMLGNKIKWKWYVN